MRECVLITGATGFIGSEFLRRILLWDSICEVVVLVRSQELKTASQRFSALCQDILPQEEVRKSVLTRITFYDSQLSENHLGLSLSDYHSLSLRLTDIYHLAADVRFDLELSQARSSNVKSTQMLLELAKEASKTGNFRRFHYLSTFTTARVENCAGAYEVPPNLSRSFKNTYEQTKAESEDFLLTHSAGIPVTIYRASMVGGDSTTGWTSKLDSFYLGVRLFLYDMIGKVSIMPVPQGGVIDAVTVDFVANVLFSLGKKESLKPRRNDNPFPSATIYHLTAGDQAISIAQGLRDSAQVLLKHLHDNKLPVPSIPDFIEVDQLDTQQFSNFLKTATSEEKEYLDFFEKLLPYAFDKCVYDNRELRKALKGTGIKPTGILKCLPELVDFCIRTQWGKIKEPRPPLGSPPFESSSLASDLPSTSTSEPIAIIGMGGLFPGAANLKEFARNLKEERVVLSEMHWSPWEAEFFAGNTSLNSVKNSQPLRAFQKIGGSISELAFDPMHFKIPPRTALAMDRIQKMVLLATEQAMAGVEISASNKNKAGMVLGYSSAQLQNDYLHNDSMAWALIRRLLQEEPLDSASYLKQDDLLRFDALMANSSPPCSEDSISGSLINVAVGRVMSHFDFHGPGYVVNSGDSSSIAAIEHAVDLLKTGEADLMIAGGAHALLDPIQWLCLFAEEKLSSGLPRPFSPNADGTVPSEGAGVLVLKRLSDALRDHDPILGLIRGLGRASGGQLPVVNETSSESIVTAMKQAFMNAESSPERIHHLEANGSAIQAEDRAELQAIQEVYGVENLQLGLLRSKMGHLSGAAGAAACIKTLLSFQQGTWFPEDPPDSELGLSVCRGVTPFNPQRLELPIQVGITSFGEWGQAYHLILEKWDPQLWPGQLNFIPIKKLLDLPIAIVSLGAILPGSQNSEEFWDNMIQKRSFVSEIQEPLWCGHREVFFQAKCTPQFGDNPEQNFTRTLDGDPDAANKSYGALGAFASGPESFDMLLGIPPLTVTKMDRLQKQFLASALQSMEGCSQNRMGPERIIIGESKSCNSATWTLALQISLMKFEFFLSQTASKIDTQIEAEAKVEAKAEAEARAGSFSRQAKADLISRLSRQLHLNSRQPDEDSWGSTIFSSAVARLAKAWNLKGGFCVIDAACASSLAAISAAVRELQLRKQDCVLSGGVGVSLTAGCNILFAKCFALSSTGSKPFDRQADGIVLGEGSATFVLKRLEDAIAAKDSIRAVIRSVGSSSDGKGHSMMAPSASGQAIAIRRALGAAQVGREQIQLIECHATGTKVGDESEIAALSEVFGDHTTLKVGSVKSQIGHTIGAAGAAGLLKVVLGLEKKIFPPMLLQNGLDPALQLQARGFDLVTNAHPWPEPSSRSGSRSGSRYDDSMPSSNGKRRAGVSAFGFGGTNWHLIVEEGPEIPKAVSPMQMKNKRMTNKRGKVVFLFPGHGSPYPDMSRRLYDRFPVFRSVLKEANEVIQPILGESIEKLIFTKFTQREKIRQNLLRTDIVQPVLLTMDIAYYRLARDFGLKPDLFLGHSVGEFAAAVASGILSFEEALLAIYHRGQIFREHQLAGRDTGKMVAVSCSSERALEILVRNCRNTGLFKGEGLERSEVSFAPMNSFDPINTDGIAVAIKNSPNQTVLSGPSAAIQQMGLLFGRAGIDSHLLPVEVGWHSPLALSLGAKAAKELFATLDVKSPRVPVMGNLDQNYYLPKGEGEGGGKGVELFPTQLVKQIGQQMDFSACIDRLYRDGARVFLEVGPKTVLSQFIPEILGKRPHRALSCDREIERFRNLPEEVTLATKTIC